ncbi:MAG: type II secretion system protein, partial [Terriglobales bacterium]
MLTLMLAVALMTIALLAALPSIKTQIKRDREEEMRHRGTAYMRAIQHYYKKFGRYPNKVEDLESTNNVRFLRKRYTDPMNRDPVTGKEKDFKFLH